MNNRPVGGRNLKTSSHRIEMNNNTNISFVLSVHPLPFATEAAVWISTKFGVVFVLRSYSVELIFIYIGLNLEVGCLLLSRNICPWKSIHLVNVLGGVLVSVLAIEPKVRGFKPVVGRCTFKGDNNPQHTFLRSGGKPKAPCRNILQHVKIHLQV
jgi:hypothetical protein